MIALMIFNNAFKEVIPASTRLEDIISHIDWDEQKKQYAIAIVRQLRDGELLIPKNDSVEEWLDFRKLTLDVTPEILKRNVSDFSLDEDIDSATNYIEKLIDDINKISSIIRFSFTGYVPRENKVIYYISWEI